ncbi:prolyl oligopeptidase family protein [Larkinella arboricola]|uniref:Prolyl oligopeptidase family protein n=1 Tax=Larkinella arboricola TaxID=643671 RepID=A0A327XAP8_LARAB|nr:prolyl oligopeptidase family serine peptidase [Larkinella arboricola]RAK03184.1 prolyl oligopeptidase family protein [Larkinella arboricola]
MKVFCRVITSFLLLGYCHTSFAQKPESAEPYIRFDDTRNVTWPSDFEVVGIPSTADGQVQKAYFYKTRSGRPEPLIISLHTWSGDYAQKDDLAALCQQRDLNYIHPDFRGANKSPSACCSELALADIDDAIAFARKHAQVDTSKIYVIGVSGGGYATLSTFMKSKHPVRKFSAWASIADLEAWHRESTILRNKYAADVIACTDSGEALNRESARRRSPLYMKTPVKRLKTAQLSIYAGIYDGLQGSVPITHSINFYNKLLTDLAVSDRSRYVSDQEKLHLLELRQPLGKLGTIADRPICLKKRSGNLTLTIFEGNHEMLTEYALNELLNE